jgi:hypothetical protein
VLLLWQTLTGRARCQFRDQQAAQISRAAGTIARGSRTHGRN